MPPVRSADGLRCYLKDFYDLPPLRHRKPGRDCAKTMMGIDWMTTKELTESIPPAYTEWIGRQLQAVALSTGRLLRPKGER